MSCMVTRQTPEPSTPAPVFSWKACGKSCERAGWRCCWREPRQQSLSCPFVPRAGPCSGQEASHGAERPECCLLQQPIAPSCSGFALPLELAHSWRAKNTTTRRRNMPLSLSHARASGTALCSAACAGRWVKELLRHANCDLLHLSPQPPSGSTWRS